MSDLGYLFAAYTVIWLLLFLYLMWIGHRARTLRRDLTALRTALKRRELE